MGGPIPRMPIKNGKPGFSTFGRSTCLWCHAARILTTTHSKELRAPRGTTCVVLVPAQGSRSSFSPTEASPQVGQLPACARFCFFLLQPVALGWQQQESPVVEEGAVRRQQTFARLSRQNVRPSSTRLRILDSAARRFEPAGNAGLIFTPASRLRSVSHWPRATKACRPHLGA